MRRRGIEIHSRRLGHHTSLDGLRGVAVLAVVAYHGFGLPGGYLGVDTFFVLSGFLITSLLLDEWDARNCIVLSNFYMRRCLRLVPALVGLVTFFLLAFSLTEFERDTVARILAQSAMIMVGFANLLGLLGAVPVMYTHLWTLGIEQQFYLAWSVLLLVCLRRGGKGITLLVAVSMALLFALGQLARPFPSGIVDSYVRSIGLPIGCSLALWRHVTPRTPPREEVEVVVCLVATVAMAFLAVTAYPVAPRISPGDFTLMSLVTAAVISSVIACPQMVVSRALGWPPLAFLGQISYGVYIWHVPVMLAVTSAYRIYTPMNVISPAALLYVAGSIVVSTISFKYLERPCLRLKAKFSTVQRTVEVLATASEAASVPS